MAFFMYKIQSTIFLSIPVFGQETELFLRSLMKKSVLISGISERQHYQFFRKIRKKIEKLLDKIVSD